jgi:ATP-dependent Lon protease
VLPALNAPDLAELPDEVTRDMTFMPVETLEQVLQVALPDTAAGTPREDSTHAESSGGSTGDPLAALGNA